jgi:1,4-alpha-glucan branching enzyme
MPLSSDLVAALLTSRLSDPFSVLGVHKEHDGWWVRVLMRDAREVVVLPRGKGSPVTLTCRAEGLFEGKISWAKEAFSYELGVVQARTGRQVNVRDPYNFWPQVSDFDLGLFQAGHHVNVGDIFGAHVVDVDGVTGVRFVVWAPNAERVAVIGDWNGFESRWHAMRPRHPYGVWEIFIPGVQPGQLYKYEILSKTGQVRIKADPFAWEAELPPATASRIALNDTYAWKDAAWMSARRHRPHLEKPMAIYECHLGSWKRGTEPDNMWPNYRVLARELIAHCKKFHFTHLELLPVAQHPYEGSWGYQVTGQYAPNCRHGTPDDFRFFVDSCHQAGIGVIVDFVPGHFPKDDFSLALFDGTPCFEYEDPREGEHKTWGTHVFNFRRPEVRNFLIGAALHWLRRFHIDALRVDAVSSMLYRNYDRQEGEWVANEQGGITNVEAVSFLQELTSTVHRECAGVLMIAEESTAWQGVTAPTDMQGLGFDLKWNMGWMHDTLRYLAQDPLMRAGCHDWITFHQWYAYDDKWVLPLSHDEVVHGKKSLVDKMHGDWWRHIAQLRLLYGYQIALPGRPLLFQGAEFAQGREWNWEKSLDWAEAEEPLRAGLGLFLSHALKWYSGELALHMRDDHRDGFQWVECENRQESVLAFLRKAPNAPDILIACNFTPIPRHAYPLGVPKAGKWTTLLDSDESRFGGSGVVNPSSIEAKREERGIFPATLRVTLPPLGIVYLRAP